MTLPLGSVLTTWLPGVTKIRAFTGWSAERHLSHVLDDVIAKVRAEHEAPALTGDE